MACIICLKEHQNESVEHIVPRAMGNIHYILPKGKVCINCNNRFSRFEHQVLNAEPFFSRRRKNGLTPNMTDPTTSLDQNQLSRFLNKIAFESLSHSRKKVISNYDLEAIRLSLLGESLPFHVLTNKSLVKGHHIPSFFDRWRLKHNGIGLFYRQHKGELWFGMKYIDLNFSIRLC